MLQKRTITVPIPVSTELDGADLELLRATFQALVALRCESGREWESRSRALEDEGWSVHWELIWHATAKRSGDYEEATGVTLDEALSELTQMTRLDMVGHTP